MKFGKRDKSIVDALFLLMVFGIFLVCALFVVLFGAKIYKNTVKQSSDSFFERTCYTYITEKIRQNDNSSGVEISDNKGSSVIMLTKNYNGNDYVTYIFLDNGYLKEYTASKESTFNPNAGTEIIALNTFEAKKCNKNLYEFHLSDDNGNQSDFFVSITSHVGEGGGFNE